MTTASTLAEKIHVKFCNCNHKVYCGMVETITSALSQARQEQREALAKYFEEYEFSDYGQEADMKAIAAKIRGSGL